MGHRIEITRFSEGQGSSEGGPAAQEMVRRHLGKVISRAEVVNEECAVGDTEIDCALIIHFEDESVLVLGAENEECVSEQHLYFDGHEMAEDLRRLKGLEFEGIVVKQAQTYDGGDRSTEGGHVTFLDIVTPRGSTTFNCYVDHNGHYGGHSFALGEQITVKSQQKVALRERQ
jgi:hypothetical protein